MKKKITNILLIFLGLILIGCAQSTGYHVINCSGEGFSESRIAEDRFHIYFCANEYTDHKDIRKYALRRASEVTTNYGYRFFTIEEEKKLDHSKYIKTKTTTGEEREKQLYCLEFTELPEQMKDLKNNNRIRKPYRTNLDRFYGIQPLALELFIRCYHDDPQRNSIDAYRFLAYET